MKRILFRVARNKGSVLGFSKAATEDSEANERDRISSRIRELMGI